MSTQFPEVLPAAWMGYRADPKRFTVIAVCAWCPDKAAADALAKAHGWEVTHSICPTCSAKLQNQIIPDSL